MSNINQLTRVADVSAGDLVPIFSTENGDARAAAMSVLLAYMQANLVFSTFDEYVSQYAAPAATGFTVVITDGDENNTNVHLILTPLAGYAAGTITLPAVASLVDKQEVLVNCTQAVTTLTIGLNGATAALGAPTTLAANAFFRLKYDALLTTWYRVG
jgi:large exoprotein involved in heme utilization and adhesion